MSLLRDSHTRRYLEIMTILSCMLIGTVIYDIKIATLIAIIFIWLDTIIFLIRRDQLYLTCTDLIHQFEDGDFSEHLPKNEEGNLFAMLSSMDRFAMTWKSMNETEQKNAVLISNRISDISHQLKTPLAAMGMYQEIIEEEPDHVEVVREFNEKSKKALVRMQQLIQTLLVMTRFDAGCIIFEKEKYEIRQLIQEAIEELETRAKKEEKRIILIGKESDLIYCDKKWTMEAISNIVKNALDHTEQNSEIKIRWEAENGIARIQISDQGTGIKNEDICHIFKRFYRSKEDKNNGVGLGLPLAKSIIEEQGGTILLESMWGQGTSMTISLLQEEA